MKNFLKIVGAAIVALLKKVVGSSDNVVVEIPEISVSQELLDNCIKIVNNFKSAVSNPVTILITDLIPGTLDNTIREKLESGFVTTLAGLTFSKNWLAAEDKAVLLNDLLNKVHFADDPDKDALYHSLCARLIVIASDGKVTWSEAAQLVETYFKQIFKNN